MAELREGWTFGWYGVGYDSPCEDFVFYESNDDVSLRKGFSHIGKILVATGSANPAWDAKKDIRNRVLWPKMEAFFKLIGQPNMII